MRLLLLIAMVTMLGMEPHVAAGNGLAIDNDHRNKSSISTGNGGSSQAGAGDTDMRVGRINKGRIISNGSHNRSSVPRSNSRGQKGGRVINIGRIQGDPRYRRRANGDHSERNVHPGLVNHWNNTPAGGQTKDGIHGNGGGNKQAGNGKGHTPGRIRSGHRNRDPINHAGLNKTTPAGGHGGPGSIVGAGKNQTKSGQIPPAGNGGDQGNRNIDIPGDSNVARNQSGTTSGPVGQGGADRSARNSPTRLFPFTFSFDSL